MKIKGLSLASMLIAAAIGLYGCTEGDDAVINITSTTGAGGGTTTNPTSVCPSFALARPQDNDGNDVCQLPPSIMTDTILTSDKVWYMASRVTVGNGNELMSVVEGTLENGDPVANVTLTIDPGTQIKGRTGSFANLLITRGSRIEANGTGQLPIVFSSDDDGEDGTAEWGGLIIHGYAPHNECLTANMNAIPCNVDAEGESGFAGGYSPDDDSGVLNHVIVTEGGFEFDIGDEINGVSLVAVGAGTEIDYVQVNSNSDDGFEFFGGRVSAKHLVLTGNLDDSVDWDEGWQGNLQHVLVIQTPGSSPDKLIEADTLGTDDFLSKPTIANATFIGASTTGARFKEETGGFLHRSIITFDSSVTAATKCVDTGGATANVGVSLVLEDVLCDGDESGDVNLLPATVADVQLAADYSSQNPAAAGLTPFKTALATFNTTYAESVADPAFFDDTDYAGAVDPAGGDDWYAGWTLPGTIP
jgi:hypothetical protein